MDLVRIFGALEHIGCSNSSRKKVHIIFQKLDLLLYLNFKSLNLQKDPVHPSFLSLSTRVRDDEWKHTSILRPSPGPWALTGQQAGSS